MKAFITFLIFIHAIFSSPEPAYSQSHPTDRAKLIEEAQKEGKVVVYASFNPRDANALKAAFERKYPSIKLDYFAAGKDKLLSKYLTEVRAGTYLPDVYQSSIFQIITLKEKGLLARYFSPERDAYNEALRDKEGSWNATYLNAVTMAYNPRLVKPEEIPSSYQELLAPKWKGKMGFNLSHTEWYVAMLQMLGEEKGRKYMEALRKQDLHARIGSSLMNQLMIAGEFSLLVSQYPTGVEELKKAGAPIEWAPLDPFFVYSIAIAATAKSAHPAAGRLYFDFVLSEDGQTVLKKLSRIPARKDVLPDPPHLIQGRKLLVVKKASSEVYDRFNNELLRYFR